MIYQVTGPLQEDQKYNGCTCPGRNTEVLQEEYLAQFGTSPRLEQMKKKMAELSAKLTDDEREMLKEMMSREEEKIAAVNAAAKKTETKKSA